MFAKDSGKSTKIRKLGNELFVQKNHTRKDHEKIWKLYSKSIATAPNNSEELAVGYANRSALLIHLEKHKDCLVDIGRALNITSSNFLKVKLFCRQTECLIALQNEKKSKSLVKAKFWLNKIDDGEKGKKNLIEMIEKVEQSLQKISKAKVSEKISDIKVPENAVYISHDSKMGRGLFAAQDFKFGEIIFKENLYVASCSNNKLYAYCSHCLAISWTAVPCDSCSYYMFCGEKCKKEAWQKYHDIECSLHLIIDTHVDYYVQMSIRLLIQGFKEAGSIRNLRVMIEEINKTADESTKGFCEDEQFQSYSFLSIFSLRFAKSSRYMEAYVRNTLHILIALAKNATIFGSNIDCFSAKCITENNDLLLIGTLILRLNLILELNAFHAIDNSFYCKKELNILLCTRNICCSKGMSFSPFFSLINHSCDANIGKFYTNDGCVVSYALKPIVKGTQLFNNYYLYRYHYVEKIKRNELLQELFEFKCECRACKYNIPIVNSQSIFEELVRLHIGTKVETWNRAYSYIKKKYKSIREAKMKHKYRRFSEKTINDFTKDVDDLVKIFKPTDYPLYIAQLYVEMLEMVMEGAYGARLHIPKDCKI